MTVKVGDTVLYGKYSGTEVTVDGTDVLSCANQTFSQSFNQPNKKSKTKWRSK